uniref:Beta-sarcoglycan n=1 Tax=Knipowitschia caucasica TaxID=637954 RepID=A0AAV2L078_KNICA
MASEQESSNGPMKKSMREKAIERRNVNKEHNSNFKAGYIPIEEERLHKTGLRGRKGNMAVCIIVLLFLLALINLIITLVIWTVIRIGPNGCDSMEFHESGLLRFKQKADMGIVHPLHKSTIGGRKDKDLVIVGNNNPVVFQQGTTKLSVEKDKTSVVSDVGISFTDPRSQNTYFSTDFENHEFNLPKGVKVLSVKKASTERITSSASSDLNIKGDGKAIIRGNEGVNIMGRTVEFKMGGGIELRAENSIVLNGSVMFNATRIPNSAGDVYFDEGLERYKLCMCADGTLFRVQLRQQKHLRLWIGRVECPVFSVSQDSIRIVMAMSPGLRLGQSTSRLRRSCVLSAPTLQLLSVQRNQLQKLPQGLGQQRSLQVLIIAFNTISTLEQKDFFHLEQLEELDLQHNLISSLHPQIFEKLYRLKHLDLSFNLLTTIHPVTYMTLQHIGADVAIRGNPWICDCRMSFLQRQRVYGNSKSLKMWFIECASPLSLSVKNLQELDKERLDCQDSNIHQEVSVQRGSTTQLPCSKSDAVWWTPIGRATKGQQQGSLLISNITEPSEGLYLQQLNRTQEPPNFSTKIA